MSSFHYNTENEGDNSTEEVEERRHGQRESTTEVQLQYTPEANAEQEVREGNARSGSGQFCVVCNQITSRLPNSAFLQPCRCGYWVHDQCLIDVIINFEDFSPGARFIGCKICRRAYNVLPTKRSFLSVAERFLKVWYSTFCSIAGEFSVILVSDILFIRMGSLTLRQIYGLEEAARFVSSMSPLSACLTVQLIPVVSIAISSFKWESGLLLKLRKCSHLPLVGSMFPMEDPELQDTNEEDPYNFLLTYVEGLLLPLYASITGKLFTRYVEDSAHRFLLGGATFLLLKGMCRMYYKQKIYVRLSTLDVENFITPYG